jgi:hypothetical protein
MTTESINERAGRLVRQEVDVCLSSLVATLAEGGTYVDGPPRAHELQDLCGQAFELCSPVQDWEEAARQAGWREENGKWTRDQDETDIANEDGAPICDMAEEACAFDGIDPYEREIFEHWSVSQWLADKLIKQGERVDLDFAGMCVWGRTTTGQEIAQDGVIRRIVSDLYQPVAA